MKKNLICFSLILSAFLCLWPTSSTFAACPGASITFAPPGPYCQNSGIVNLSISGLGSATGVFGGDGVTDGGNSSTATFDPSDPAVMAGNNTITFVVLSPLFGNGGCSIGSTVSQTVVVEASGAAPIIVGADACDNQDVMLVTDGGVGATYAWSDAGNTTSSNLDILAAAAVDGAGYTVTVTSAGGCVSTATVALTLNPLPTVVAVSTAACGGEAVALSVGVMGGSGAMYIWSDAIGSTTSDLTILAGTAVDGTVYTVTVTNDTGCASTTSVAITVNAVPTAIAVSTAVCGNESVELSVSAPGATAYIWSDAAGTMLSNATIPMGMATDGDVYTVTVTNAATCTSTATIAITVNPVPTITALTTASCAGSNVMLNLSGAGVGATYAWSLPATGMSSIAAATVLPGDATDGQVYTVTVTSAAGCIGTATVAITVNTLPTAVAVSTIACGSEDVALSVGVMGGSGAIYAWSTPATGTTSSNATVPMAMANDGDVYTVTVTNDTGCTTTATVALTVNPVPTVVAITSAVCADAPGTVTPGVFVLLAGSTPLGASYEWSGGLAPMSTDGNNAEFTASGNDGDVYTVTVTTAEGCTSTASVAISINPLPTGIAVTTATCADENVALSATGGAAYAWSTTPVSIGSDLTIPAAMASDGAVYTVTVTSDKGCTSTATVAITVNTLPTAVAVSTIACGNEDVALSVGVMGGSGAIYAWSTPATGTTSSNATVPMAMANDGDVYTVTVTNDTGCTTTATVALTVNPVPTVVAITSAVCADVPGTVTPGVFVLLAGSTPLGASYEWSGGLAPMSTDGNNAEFTAAANDGDVYTVTVTTAEGCTGTASVAITINALPTAMAMTTGICEGDDVVLTTSVMGGSGSTYVWSDVLGSTGSMITVSGLTDANDGDVYTVTVTNDTSCSTTATVAVTVATGPIPTAVANPTAICAGDPTPGLAVATQDILTDTFEWSNGHSGVGILGFVTSANQGAGIYTVTATNATTGCSATATVEAIINPLPTATAMTTAVCAGENVDLSVGVMGGSGSTYEWSDALGSLTSDVMIIGALDGTVYTVTVTNDTGCSTTSEVTITVNALPTAMAMTTVSCAGEDVSLSATGGVTYAWSTTPVSMGSDLTIPGAMASDGTVYTVTVTSAENCTHTASVAITVNALPTAMVMTTAECAGTDVALSATGGVTYAWSTTPVSMGSDLTIPGAMALDGTVYTVTITNVEGCTSTGSVAISVNALPTAMATGDDLCAGETGILTAMGGSMYEWSNGATTATASVTPAMTTVYTVTVTEVGGCTSTATTEVTVNPVPTATAMGDEICAGDGAMISATGGATYMWSNGATTATASVTPAMTTVYTVTVTEVGGCTSTATTEVTVNPTPAASITGVFAFCPGRGAMLDAGAYPTTPNVYAWSNGATTQTIATIVVGVYTVTVTNVEGCSATSSVEVSATPCLASIGTFSLNTTICPGDPIIATTVGENQGVGYDNYFFVYSEDNLGNTTYVTEQAAVSSMATFSGLTPGDYVVCAYNECQNCVPTPSPIGTSMDDITDTGLVQDGCYDYDCQSITVAALIAPIAGTGQTTEDNSTGQNVFIAEVCGGTPPYNVDFTYSEGYGSVQEYPSTTPGCTAFQVVYTDPTEWTLSITDSNGCSNGQVVYTSDGLPTDPLPQIESSTVSPETCTDKDGEIKITVEGGDDSCVEYTYAVTASNGYTAAGQFTMVGGTGDFVLGSTVPGSGLSGALTYSVTVTDCALPVGTTTIAHIYVPRIIPSGGRGRGGCRGRKADLDTQLLETVKVYPNPFTDGTTIEFSILESAHVDATIYTTDSREVAKVYNGQAEGGILYKVPFNSESLPSGIYILQVTTDSGAVHHERLYIAK